MTGGMERGLLDLRGLLCLCLTGVPYLPLVVFRREE